MKGEFYLVQKAVGYDVDLLGNECDEQRDRLFTQLVVLKQKKAADKIILCYKDYRNGKAASFVKNPVNKSGAAFVKLSAWIDKAFKINGRECTKFNSTKRTAKHVRRHNGESFGETLKDLIIGQCLVYDIVHHSLRYCLAYSLLHIWFID